MTFETIEQATAVLQDETASEKERVNAAHYLGRTHSEVVVPALIAAMDDDDFGVHWAASEGLAHLGDYALPGILKALTDSHCSPRVFEGAKHVFHTSGSPKVKTETNALLQTMHGDEPSIESMEAASELMRKLKIS